MPGATDFVATATRIETERAGPEIQSVEVTTTVVAVRSTHDNARDALSSWVRTNVALGEDGVSWQLAVTGVVSGDPVDVTRYEMVPTVALVHNATTDIQRS